MKTVVKKMTPEIKRLDLIKMKRRNFADSVIFAPALFIAHLKNRADLADCAVFEAIGEKWPQLRDMNQQLRKDSTIVFTEYKSEEPIK